MCKIINLFFLLHNNTTIPSTSWHIIITKELLNKTSHSQFTRTQRISNTRIQKKMMRINRKYETLTCWDEFSSLFCACSKLNFHFENLKSFFVSLPPLQQVFFFMWRVWKSDLNLFFLSLAGSSRHKNIFTFET